MNVTPRTNIDGAHQQGVFVKAGARLSSSKSLFAYKRFYLVSAIAVAFVAYDWIPNGSSLGLIKQKLVSSFTAFSYLPSGFQFVMISSLIISLYFLATSGSFYARFAYNCFIKPFFHKKRSGIDSNEHQERLEEFYAGQADIYDVTRRRLLRGRSTMLKLCAAQLRQVYPCSFTPVYKGDRFGLQEEHPHSPPLSPTFLSNAGKRFAWIDVGGGTGENIERMNSFFPISNFERVYLVDITPSLCEIARERFARLGWTNVKVLCLDAANFEIPAEDGDDLDIALITMSYSLTMIETFYPIIDRLAQVLAPSGIFGVSDFYVSAKRSADPTRQLSWLMRWFWAIWFDQDNVYLSPGRREYLEHKFKTIKTLNSLNTFIKPFVKIPFYVWVGAQKGILNVIHFSRITKSSYRLFFGR
ncbi:S-adenosyl-L-methionine-dependent methyltransferase [Globomyces pollinis-pini]|nr:S-adenosyl-L-methionine-dependent methyltransferase [Globomyces pollinis-pini]